MPPFSLVVLESSVLEWKVVAEHVTSSCVSVVVGVPGVVEINVTSEGVITSLLEEVVGAVVGRVITSLKCVVISGWVLVIRKVSLVWGVIPDPEIENKNYTLVHTNRTLYCRRYLKLKQQQ